MSTSDWLNPDWWIKRAIRIFVAILGILLFASFAVRTPIGPLLFLGAFGYIAYRIWTVSPARATKPPQRNSAGAERTPVLPGEARR